MSFISIISILFVINLILFEKFGINIGNLLHKNIKSFFCLLTMCNSKKWCIKCELPLCGEHFQGHEACKGYTI